SIVFKPIVSLLTASTNGMLRLLRVDPDEEEDVYSEEEIRMMATAGSQQGTIGEQENEFIQNLFEFDDLRAEEFATHRTKMSVLWADGTTEDWEREIFSSRHSLYPVCRILQTRSWAYWTSRTISPCRSAARRQLWPVR
ncbi:MAG: CNNM domain-containing protein, partial [Oscillospiraceae bacterium]